MDARLEKRKLGRFTINRHLIENWERLLPLMAKIVVVRCEADYATDCLQYTAFSELFEPVREGEIPPDYIINIGENPATGEIEIAAFKA